MYISVSQTKSVF